MRVHIVASDWQSDSILARLARTLVDATGWTINERPNPKADLNYFFPYLDLKGECKTPIAAWFTHRDIGRESKLRTWDSAARRADLRLTCARQYADSLNQFGLTALVTPPLDRTLFDIELDHITHTDKKVGVAGYVYPGGRKGEQFVKRLVMDFPKVNFAASGRGWPVSTRNYEFSELPFFYRSLDVLICTSTIEGIGYPPLEALACGIPVVIPRHVGVFDDLPETDGIYYYVAGDYESLSLALDSALQSQAIDRNALRGATARFTAEAWVNDHIQIFEAFLEPAPPLEVLPDWRARAGVFYVAYGKQARDCVQKAIGSIRIHMPGLPVCLVSDEPLGMEDYFIQQPDKDLGARSVKTRIYDLAPAAWQYVVYLDADTELAGDISFLFTLLQDGWDFAICTNPAQYVEISNGIRPDNRDEMDLTIAQLGTGELVQPNGGVFAFRRNERTALLMRSWHEEWNRFGKRDQAALDRALYAHPVKTYLLSAPWNCITRYLKPNTHTAIIHHPLQARRWQGVVHGRLDSSEAWAAIHPERNPDEI